MSALEYEWELESQLGGGRAVSDGMPSQATIRRVGNAAARAALARGLSTEAGVGLGEFEREFEGEGFVNPLRRVYPDAMMEHLAHAATETESEAEAEAFIGALIPIAARLLPRAAPVIARAAPGLVRGVAAVTRTLRANPATRQLVRAVPTIVRRTAADIARQGQRGPVTPDRAVRTLARQTQQVLCRPHQRQRALRRNVALDRRYHRAAASRPGLIAS
jgi:hypothetical protein